MCAIETRKAFFFGLVLIAIFATSTHAQPRAPRKDSTALIIRHIPNPVKPIYSPQVGAYQWRYRTEVKNNLDVSLQIIEHGLYGFESSTSAAMFSKWYNDGDSTVDGWIPPGKVAVRAKMRVNWSWPVPAGPLNWFYKGRDAEGNEYHGEAEIRPVPAYAKFRFGDDSTWSRPEFDDSEWEQIPEFSSRLDRWPGIGWFRYVLEIDSTFRNGPLAVVVQHAFGAYEFYLDGTLVYRIGKVGTAEEEEETHHGYHSPQIITFPSNSYAVAGKSRHILAERVSNFQLLSPVFERDNFLEWRIQNYDEAIRERAEHENLRSKTATHQVFLTGVFLAFALVHLLQFFFYPQFRANLFFGALSASSALTVYVFFLAFMHLDISDPADLVWTGRLQNIALVLTTLLAIRLTHLLIYPRLHKIFLAFCVLGLILAIVYWSRPLTGPLYIVPFLIIAFAEILRVLLISRFRRHEIRLEGGWIIMLGFIPLSLTTLYYLFSEPWEGILWLHILPKLWHFSDFPAPFYAMALLMISVSIFLSRNFARTTAHRAELNRELEIAREVQQRLFPQNLPLVSGLDYCGSCRPAQSIGGDYYDFLILPNGMFGLAIGDVSGKGISAALLMASLQASLRGQALRGSADLADLMGHVNRLVYEASSADRFATIFYGHYDPKTRNLTYVNAGHNAPLVLSNGSQRLDEELHVVRLDSGGPPVGILPHFQYEQASISLRSGDLFLAFSDGISEAMNPAQEQYSEERLIESARSCFGLSASDTLSLLMQTTDGFVAGAKQHDDMTMLVVRVI